MNHQSYTYVLGNQGWRRRDLFHLHICIFNHDALRCKFYFKAETFHLLAQFILVGCLLGLERLLELLHGHHDCTQMITSYCKMLLVRQKKALARMHAAVKLVHENWNYCCESAQCIVIYHFGNLKILCNRERNPKLPGHRKIIRFHTPFHKFALVSFTKCLTMTDFHSPLSQNQSH